jgi:hypothetical protein
MNEAAPIRPPVLLDKPRTIAILAMGDLPEDAGHPELNRLVAPPPNAC